MERLDLRLRHHHAVGLCRCDHVSFHAFTFLFIGQERVYFNRPVLPLTWYERTPFAVGI